MITSLLAQDSFPVETFVFVLVLILTGHLLGTIALVLAALSRKREISRNLGFAAFSIGVCLPLICKLELPQSTILGFLVAGSSQVEGVIVMLWLGIPLSFKRQSKKGCCTKCGYDLRATPDRCPECGTIPEKPLHP
jgi:hypothetical protein